MGKVYHGRDNLLRDVAIKEFSLSQSEDFDTKDRLRLKEDFYTEACLLANLKHEALPTVYNYVVEGDTPYLIMEFIEGENLQKRLEQLRRSGGQFAIKTVRLWAEELLNILIYLHEQNPPVFHRDIKPKNLKTRNDKICLLDFGLSKGLPGKQTKPGYTLSYAPIEQINNGKTVPQTDLYALGATLYYLLIGEGPIDAAQREKEIKGGRDPLRHIKELREGLDDAFAGAIMKALSLNAQYRPPSARAMLAMLKSQSSKGEEDENEETVVRPGSRLEAMKRWKVGKPAIRRWVVVAFALVTLSLLGIGVYKLLPTTPTVTANRNGRSLAQTGRLNVSRNLYERPFNTAKIIQTLPKGAEVQIQDESQDDDPKWYQVIATSGTTGWVSCTKSEAPCLTSK